MAISAKVRSTVHRQVIEDLEEYWRIAEESEDPETKRMSPDMRLRDFVLWLSIRRGKS
jgi:hypothetical protein